MIKVNSSNIDAVDYNRSTHILSVLFLKSAHVYHYYDVPEEVYLAMMNSGDVGTYFSRNIKKRYHYD